MRLSVLRIGYQACHQNPHPHGLWKALPIAPTLHELLHLFRWNRDENSAIGVLDLRDCFVSILHMRNTQTSELAVAIFLRMGEERGCSETDYG